MFFLNTPQSQPPFHYLSSYPSQRPFTSSLNPYTTPKNSTVFSMPKTMLPNTFYVSPQNIAISSPKLISPQNSCVFQSFPQNSNVFQPISRNSQSFIINQPTPLQNIKRNLDSVYEELMNKLAKERINIISPTRQQFCKFIDEKSDTYEGEMIGKVRNGYGILRNKWNKEIYNGDWKKDKFDGIGTLFNNSIEKFNDYFDYKNFGLLGKKWKKYEGDFLEGKKQGLGTIYLGNGESFHGYFARDQINGEGTFIRKNGEIVIGRWRNNELVCVL